MDELNGVNLNPLGLDLSLSSLLAGFVFGVVGVYIFRSAKRSANYPLLFVSVLLMSYTLFTHGWWQDWGIGLGLCALANYFHKNGGEKTG